MKKKDYRGPVVGVKHYKYCKGDKVYWGLYPYPYIVDDYDYNDPVNKKYWVSRGMDTYVLSEKSLHNKEEFLHFCQCVIDKLTKKYEKEVRLMEGKMKIVELGKENPSYDKSKESDNQ